MTQTLVIYRKGGDAARPTPSKADVAAMGEDIATRCRVKRDGIVAFFTPDRANVRSEFYKLPELAPAVIDNPVGRMAEHGDAGWVVPASDLGRAPKHGERDFHSTSQSVLLWIKQNLSDVVDPNHVSVVVEDR